MSLLPIFQTCIPREEIQSGELSLDLFAAKLRLVVDGNAPQVYQEPNVFFANTFPTDGLKTLIEEVFGRLSGVTIGAPIIRLETSFGGGKTHDEIALWHICKQGRQIQGLERFANLNSDLAAFLISHVRYRVEDDFKSMLCNDIGMSSDLPLAIGTKEQTGTKWIKRASLATFQSSTGGNDH